MESENPLPLDKIAKALVSAQREFGAVEKNKRAVYGKYADLHRCWDAVRSPLLKNGICMTQLTQPSKEGILLKTRLIHESGQYIESEVFMPAKDTNNPQTFGAALTYARRYGLCAITGLVADDDDDGNAAAGRLNSAQAVVDRVKKSLPPMAGTDCPRCGKPNMMKSNYNEGEMYCNPKEYKGRTGCGHKMTVTGDPVIPF